MKSHATMLWKQIMVKSHKKLCRKVRRMIKIQRVENLTYANARLKSAYKEQISCFPSKVIFYG
jgi:ribosomal protein L15E